MFRFVEAEPRSKAILFSERIEDYIDEKNPVRALDVFVDMLDLGEINDGHIGTPVPRVLHFKTLNRQYSL